MYDYYPYWKKNRHNNNCLPLTKVAQTKDFVIRAKVDLEMHKKVKEDLLKEGELIRKLLTKYFQAKEKIKNREDVEHFLENV